jgi:hypothetical protein
VPDEAWTKTLADGRRVKFSHDQLTEITFITAQLEGNEVVYSVMLAKTEIRLSREEVERRFEHELSKK